jgi:hypothetical protein
VQKNGEILIRHVARNREREPNHMTVGVFVTDIGEG